MPKRKSCKKCGFPLILGGSVDSLEGFKHVRIYVCSMCNDAIFMRQDGNEIRRIKNGSPTEKGNG